MPNWISITVDTLNEAKVAALITACSTAAKAEGQDDRAEGIIQGVVNEIRLKVASCERNRVDEDETTIPRGLRDLAIDMIMGRLKNAIEEELTPFEEKQLDRHDRRLIRISKCEELVDMPDEPVAPEVETSGGGAWGSRTKLSMRTEEE